MTCWPKKSHLQWLFVVRSSCWIWTRLSSTRITMESWDQWSHPEHHPISPSESVWEFFLVPMRRKKLVRRCLRLLCHDTVKHEYPDCIVVILKHSNLTFIPLSNGKKFPLWHYFVLKFLYTINLWNTIHRTSLKYLMVLCSFIFPTN